LWSVFIGIESINEETLKEVRKGFNFSKVLKALEILHKNNIIVIGNLIIGLDLNATEMDIKKEIQFMKHVDVDIISYCLLTPFPGSETLKDLEAKNLIITKDWSKYTVFDPVMKTFQLSPKILLDLLYYSFRELKILNNWRGIASRIVKTRGLIFVLNPIQLISLIKSFLKVRYLFK